MEIVILTKKNVNDVIVLLQCKMDDIKFYENCGYKVSGFSIQGCLK